MKHVETCEYLAFMPVQQISFFFLCYYIGEQEFTARTAGLSSIIVFSIMIPLLLLIIVISYRYIQRKNLELEVNEKEIYFAELEEQRQKIYESMYNDQVREEIEIIKNLEKQRDIDGVPQIPSNQIPSNVIDDDKNIEKIDHGDETDDEFFEMPLPPVPMISPNSGKLSIIDNEGVSPSTSFLAATTSIQETPKMNNSGNVFIFSQPTPTPADNLEDNFSLAPHSPKSKTSGYLEHPVIIDCAPKLPLQSDF